MRGNAQPRGSRPGNCFGRVAQRQFNIGQAEHGMPMWLTMMLCISIIPAVLKPIFT
jgi:hypothetical protein